jgi:ribonuclease P protein component
MRRNQRLQRPEQFGRVRREGKSWAHPFFVLNAARNRAGRTRCGFVTGKKLGKAHDRNRAKRRVREAVRLVYEEIAPGYDLVFVLRSAVLDAPFVALQQAVVTMLERAQLWQPHQEHAGCNGTIDD